MSIGPVTTAAPVVVIGFDMPFLAAGAFSGEGRDCLHSRRTDHRALLRCDGIDLWGVDGYVSSGASLEKERQHKGRPQ
jgi:hypothetical protein